MMSSIDWCFVILLTGFGSSASVFAYEPCSPQNAASPFVQLQEDAVQFSVLAACDGWIDSSSDYAFFGGWRACFCGAGQGMSKSLTGIWQALIHPLDTVVAINQLIDRSYEIMPDIYEYLDEKFPHYKALKFEEKKAVNCEVLGNILMGVGIGRAVTLVMTKYGISAAQTTQTAEGLAGKATTKKMFSKNTLRFTLSDPAEVKTFSQAPKWDGSTRIPPNIAVKSTVSVEGSSVGQVSFDTGSIQAQSQELRRLLKNIKRRSFSRAPDREREFGAFIVDYQDGTSKVVQFTSNRPGTILGQDMKKAISSSGLFSNPNGITRVYHIHTHPSTLNPKLNTEYIGPSPNDYKYIQDLKKWMRDASEREVEVEGIVLPSCQHCDDLFFRYQPEGFLRG